VETTRKGSLTRQKGWELEEGEGEGEGDGNN